MPHRKVVFIVENDAGLLTECARLLRQFGYASLQFQSAAAFANHGDFGETICVLLDINLGDGSGIELRHRLKAAGHSVPVIYMTGNDTLLFARLRFNPGASPISQSHLPRNR